MGIALRNFRCTLNTEFIQPNKDNRSHLKLPPWEYPRIRKLEWKQFVYKVLGPEFEVKCFTTMLIHCYLENLFVLINDDCCKPFLWRIRVIKRKRCVSKSSTTIVWVVQVIVACWAERYHMTASSNQFFLYNSEILFLSHKIKLSFVLVNME